MLVKNCSAIGVHWGVCYRHRPDVVLSVRDDILRRYRAGELRPPVSPTLPLDGIPDALAELEARGVAGRLVLTP